MSAPCERAESPAPCACTNISLMQLFHELKQKFPGVPDHVVSNTIELYCHDKQACEKHLHSEVKASLTHAYHASSSAAARHLNQLKLNPPLKCRNQPIIKHSVDRPTLIKAVTCPGPQKGILSSAEDKENKLNTDANQNIVVEAKNEDIIRANDTSPVTIINLDSCHVKYNADSPSDIELSNENRKPEQELSNKNTVEPNQVPEQPESTNYRILKSNKIKSNLNERLERVKEKKTIKKEPEKEEEPQPAEPPEQPPNPPPQEKPKRPNTLDFIKPNPDFAFKPSQRAEGGSPAGRGARGYAPLNLSVNVNCHMDLSRGYEGWVAEYDSPRAITSVNLTVCTPSSGMASPERDEDGFEGHVTVTVSPTAPPRRRAPPPPAARLRPARPAPPTPAPPSNNDHTPSTPTQHVSDRSLIERQKERLGRLASALSQEKGRLVQLSKETQILAAAPPSPSAAQRLRDYVERLRDQCDTLAKRLEMAASEAEESNNFYSNIYTGQRPPSSWQCHMCTFRNHPLLDKCEECDMPRILVVRARDGITVRLMPGRRKITRSWVL